MEKRDLCAANDVRVGALTPIAHGRATLVLTRLPCGALRAMAGRCPHQGAELEFGSVTGYVDAGSDARPCVARAGEILRCPWHGFEFDLASGEPVVPAPETKRMRLRFFDVAEEDGRIVLRR